MRTLLSILALAACSFSAQAQVRYVFDGQSGNVGGLLFAQSFTLDVADYITTDTTFDTAQLAECIAALQPCTSVGFQVQDLNDPTRSVINFRAQNTTTHYYFPAAAFLQPGVYQPAHSHLFNPATLTVTGPPVPEPAAMLLMLVGLGCLHVAIRRPRGGRQTHEAERPVRAPLVHWAP